MNKTGGTISQEVSNLPTEEKKVTKYQPVGTKVTPKRHRKIFFSRIYGALIPKMAQGCKSHLCKLLNNEN